MSLTLFAAVAGVPAELLPEALTVIADPAGDPWTFERGPDSAATTWARDAGTQAEVADRLDDLTRRAPFSWMVWVEPGEKDPGTLTAYHPGLGTFRGECDGAGRPVVDPGALLEALDNATTLEQARARADAVTGRPWLAAIAQTLDRATPAARA